jgi:vacuolar-type H+-ATPase subunit H
VLLLGRLSLYGRGAERLHEEIVTVAARWLEPSRRKGLLVAYATEAETKTLDLLNQALGGQAGRSPSVEIERRLLDTVDRDIDELLPQLEPRAQELGTRAIQRLRERAEREAKALRETLEQQRKRVLEELAKHDKAFDQLTFNFNEEEKRQLEADMRAWRLRLQQFDRDLDSEPTRIRDFYDVRAQRIEPVGIVYLWPETN